MNKNSSVRCSIPYVFNDVQDVKVVKYDDIVDRTEFKTSLEKERNFRIGSENDGGGFVSGQYDSQDNSFPKHMPTPTEVQLRTGLVSDPADIDTLEKITKKSAQSEIDKGSVKAENDKLKKISAARQSHLDSLSGFDSSKIE